MNTDQNKEYFTHKLVNREQLKGFLELLSRIPEHDPSIFFAFNKDIVQEIFDKSDTVCTLVYDNNIPIAGGFIWRPSDKDSPALKAEHEGDIIGLPTDSYLQLDDTVVDPKYRGQKLQRFVIESLLKIAKLPVVAIVSPTNPKSIANLEHCGFKIQKTVKWHGDYMRHVMIAHPSHLE